MVGKQPPQARQHVPHLVGRRVVPQPEDRLQRNLVSPREVDEPELCELGVGDRHERPVDAADARRPEADLLDGALVVAELAALADPHRFVGEEHEPRNEVFDRVLGGEGDGQAAHTEAGDQGCHRDAHRVGPEDHHPGHGQHRQGAEAEPHDLRVDRSRSQPAGANHRLPESREHGLHQDDAADEHADSQRRLDAHERGAGDPNLVADRFVAREACAHQHERRDEREHERLGSRPASHAASRDERPDDEAAPGGQQRRRCRPLPDRHVPGSAAGPRRESANPGLGNHPPGRFDIHVVQARAAGVSPIGQVLDDTKKVLGAGHGVGGEHPFPSTWPLGQPNERDFGVWDSPAGEALRRRGGSVGNLGSSRECDAVQHFLEAHCRLAPRGVDERRRHLGKIEAVGHGSESPPESASLVGRWRAVQQVVVHRIDRLDEALERGPRARGIGGSERLIGAVRGA